MAVRWSIACAAADYIFCIRLNRIISVRSFRSSISSTYYPPSTPSSSLYRRSWRRVTSRNISLTAVGGRPRSGDEEVEHEERGARYCMASSSARIAATASAVPSHRRPYSCNSVPVQKGQGYACRTLYLLCEHYLIRAYIK